MSRLGNIGEQYFDSNGDPLSGGKLYFYESGTTTAKNTYSDADESVANANPVVLDAAGRQPDIFFSGSARCILKTSDDVQVEVRDPIGAVTLESAFSAWVATVTYDAEDIVQGSNLRYYQSIISNNLGNDPTSTSNKWQEIRFVAVWDSAYTYLQGALVVGSNGALYRCINGASTGDDPTSTPAEWSLIGSSGLNNLVEDTTPQLGGDLDMNGNSIEGVSETEMGYLSTVTSNVQTQLNGKLANVVEDTTPQLGGNLDMNGNSITGRAVFSAEIVETVFAVTGTTPELDPADGTVQTWTLTGASTPTEVLTTGEYITLLIDTPSHEITWPTMEWIGGSAPTLDTTNTNVIELWKVGTTLYGALVGVAS